MKHQSSDSTAAIMQIPVAPTASTASPRRVKIYFQDEQVRQRSEERMRQVLTTAVSPTASDNNALLARKALKYRKMLKRVEGADVMAPNFDASKFMGIDWCKTANLKAYCQRKQ